MLTIEIQITDVSRGVNRIFSCNL